jgi:PAS domain S-box-containing protein
MTFQGPGSRPGTLAGASDKLLRAVVESSPSGLVMVDASGTIVLVNRETERLFGYERTELLGRSIEVLVPTRFRDIHACYRDEFADHPQTRPMGAGRDLFGVRKGGAEIPIEIGLSPVETDQGAFVLATIVDISRRKHAEEELRRSNEELERFAYVASHDLQEPLRTITSYLQLLSRRYRERLEGDAVEFIDFAVGGAIRMQRLIEDLLAFSRAGTRGREAVPIDANLALRRVLDGLRAAIDESGALVTHDLLPHVLGDPGQFEQLLANLVGNALKFRAVAAPQVHVGARRDGRYWQFSVRDNGIGIDQAYFDRIFVIFQRLHAPDEYPGTGVGLAICKKIVERHGGKIWLQSSTGEGSTFYFTVPGAPE